MERFWYMVFLCCLCLVSCEGTDIVEGEPGNVGRAMTVSLRFAGSRAPDYDAGGGRIEDVCIAVFDENDNMEEFVRMSAKEMGEGLSARLLVATGPKTVHAVANASEALAGDLAAADTKEEFLSVVTSLDRDNTVTETATLLLMYGSINGNDSVIDVAPADAGGLSSCTIEMGRMVSKICLHKITNLISEPPVWKGCDISVTGIFLLDAVAQDCIGEGRTSRPVYADQEYTPLLGDIVTDCNLVYGSSYEKGPFAYYTYPGSGGRVTKLCLETVLKKGDARRKCYYSIPVEGMRRNRMYNINCITIKSEGTDNPGDEHSYDYVSVNLDDALWDAGEDTILEY